MVFLISPGLEAEQDTVVAKPPGAAGMGLISKIYGKIGIYAAVFDFAASTASFTYGLASSRDLLVYAVRYREARQTAGGGERTG